MAIKTASEVLIGGKVYTLSGYESEEYLQRIASYLNGKLNEYSHVEAFRRANVDRQNVLMQINIADDYFKSRKQIGDMEEDMNAKEKELYDLKHDSVNKDMTIDSLRENIKQAQEELHESAKRIVQLETELRDRKK